MARDGRRCRMAGVAAVAALLLVGTAPPPANGIGPVPDAVRAEFGITSRWYAKYLNADGIPVLGSAGVSDAALYKAQRQAMLLMRTMPRSVAAQLRSQHNRIVILAADEGVGDIPEFAAAFPDRSIDQRFWAGFGATLTLPITSGTEENLLRHSNQENIFVHEFAHTVGELGLASIDPVFVEQLQQAYAAAQAAGLWNNSYAGSSLNEYWAEGVQTYFDVNREGVPGGDGVHNHVNTRSELADHDRLLFALLRRVYGDAELR